MLDFLPPVEARYQQIYQQLALNMTAEHRSMFLTDAEVAELTGIKRGRDGRTKAERQSLQLSKMGVHHYVSAIGRVIVPRAVIEGPTPQSPPPVLPKLRPRCTR